MASSDNIPLQIRKAPNPSDECKTSSTTDILPNDSRPEVKNDTDLSLHQRQPQSVHNFFTMNPLFISAVSMASSEIRKAPSEQTDECTTSSNSDTLTNDSKHEFKKDTCHPQTIEDNQYNNDIVQPSGVLKDGHGDMPQIKSKIVPELVAESGDVPKATTPKLNTTDDIADDHGETPETTPESIADASKTSVSDSSSASDENGHEMKTTVSKSSSEAEVSGEMSKTEASESESKTKTYNLDDATKTIFHESTGSKDVTVELDGATQAEALQDKAITDAMPFDVELDLVLDDQVMSFVNLAISNATKSIYLHDNAEHDSFNASSTDEIKSSESPKKRGEASAQNDQDEKQSIDACQIKENATQQQSLISNSQIETPANEVETRGRRESRDTELVKDLVTLPGDLAIADPMEYPNIVVEKLDDDDAKSKQGGDGMKETTDSLQNDKECMNEDGTDMAEVSCQRLDGPAGLQESESLQPQNIKLPDENIAKDNQHITMSKDNDSQNTCIQNGQNDVSEEDIQSLNENTVQDEPFLAAKNKDQQDHLHKNESNDANVLTDTSKCDLQKEENVENKQDEISALKTNTELSNNLAKINESDNTNNQDKFHIIVKTNNEPDNQKNESYIQQKDTENNKEINNAQNNHDELHGTKEENANDSRKEEVGIPVKKVNGIIDVRVSSDEASDTKLREELSIPKSSPEDSARESGLALVNDRLRVRIADLQSQIKEICCELAFVGDRNWRLEAYTECLIHTLEKMGVTDIEDLDQTTLSLELFKVKVKAGYRLGPYNGLPQRARRSYKRDGITPPTIDLSGGSLTCHNSKDSKSKLPFSILETDDIGLSVKQMQQYEARIETLTMKNHFLETQLQHLRNTNPNIGVFPPQDSPIPFDPSVHQGIYQPGMEHLVGGFPTPSVPPPQIMQPMVPTQVDMNHSNTNIESCMADPMPQQPTSPPKPTFSAPLPPKEADPPKHSTYVPPPRFRNKVNPHATTSLPNVGRRNGSGNYRNDGWYGHGRSAHNLTTSGPSWRRTDRTGQSSAWRKPSYCN